MTRVRARMTVAIGALAALLGCTYAGGDIGDPGVRKLQWFSYVEGEDIRRTCESGLPDRYRLVYNGLYQEQLRMYEIDSLRKTLSVHVVGDPKRFQTDDLLAPWRADRLEVALDEKRYADLVRAFADSGMFAPPPVGLRLPSRSYYWTAAACRNGIYTFTAWAHPSDRFDRATFGDMLFAIDPSGIPVNLPKPVPFDPQYELAKRNHEVADFTLEVGRRGLVR